MDTTKYRTQIPVKKDELMTNYAIKAERVHTINHGEVEVGSGQ